jgi:hypothetical protein
VRLQTRIDGANSFASLTWATSSSGSQAAHDRHRKLVALEVSGIDSGSVAGRVREKTIQVGQAKPRGELPA